MSKRKRSRETLPRLSVPTEKTRVKSDLLATRFPWWLPLALIGGLLAVYFPALHGSLLWDDQAHVTPPALRSLSGLGKIWFQLGATQQYYPLLHSAFWLEHRLWGDAFLGYHLVNVALHAGAACLFALTLQRLAIPGAWFAATIFAFHPVHVESVAWISEQKNTLSLVFYLSAALLYLRFDRDRRPRWWALAFLLFVLGLLTKTVTATLPGALLVIFWWQRGRLTWKQDVLPLVPWFLLGASAGLFTAWVERNLIGAQGAAYELAFVERLLLAGRVLVFYLSKLFGPAKLTFIYPRWEIDASLVSHWLPLIGIIVLAGLLWWWRRHARGPLAAFLFFAGSLFPVLGFFNVYPFVYSFVADHFQYLASLGIIALVAAGFAHAFSNWRRLTSIAAAAMLLGLAVLTWRQSHLYQDSQTLFRAAIVRNPTCWMAYNNLGKELLSDRSRLPEAIDLFRQALVHRPAYAEASNNLGLALTQSGRPAEAIPHFEQALQLQPKSFQTYNNLGIALASSGRPDAALDAFQRAAALNPVLPNIQENWGKALILLGRREEAAERFAEAARLRAQAIAPK